MNDKSPILHYKSFPINLTQDVVVSLCPNSEKCIVNCVFGEE